MSSSFSGCINVIFDMVSQLFSFRMPWGLSFGAVIVGVFGAPLLVLAIKKFF